MILYTFSAASIRAVIPLEEVLFRSERPDDINFNAILSWPLLSACFNESNPLSSTLDALIFGSDKRNSTTSSCPLMMMIMMMIMMIMIIMIMMIPLNTAEFRALSPPLFSAFTSLKGVSSLTMSR